MSGAGSLLAALGSPAAAALSLAADAMASRTDDTSAERDAGFDRALAAQRARLAADAGKGGDARNGEAVRAERRQRQKDETPAPDPQQWLTQWGPYAQQAPAPEPAPGVPANGPQAQGSAPPSATAGTAGPTPGDTTAGKPTDAAQPASHAGRDAEAATVAASPDAGPPQAFDRADPQRPSFSAALSAARGTNPEAALGMTADPAAAMVPLAASGIATDDSAIPAAWPPASPSAASLAAARAGRDASSNTAAAVASKPGVASVHGNAPVSGMPDGAVARTAIPTDFSAGGDAGFNGAMADHAPAEAAAPIPTARAAEPGKDFASILAASPAAPSPLHHDEAGALAKVPGAPAPAQGHALAARMGEAVRWMAGNGLQHASLQVDPGELGPITIHVRQQGDTTSVAFASASAQTRHQLESLLGTLRDALASGGMTLGHASVGSDSSNPAFSQDTRQRQEDKPPAARDPARAGRDGAESPVSEPAGRPPRNDGRLSLYA